MKLTTIFLLVLVIITFSMGSAYLILVSLENPGTTEAFSNVIPSSKSVWATCPDCNSNILDVQECVEYLKVLKDTPDFKKAAEQQGIDEIVRVEKTLSASTGKGSEVVCYYYPE